MTKLKSLILLLAPMALSSCLLKKNDTAASTVSEVTQTAVGPYSVYVASGFPLATGAGIVSEWSNTGQLVRKTLDYSSMPSFMPQSIATVVSQGLTKLLVLGFGGSAGRIDSLDPDGSSYGVYIDNPAAFTTGTRRLEALADGGLLVARSAGVERFNSNKQRVGAAARYVASGTCAATAVSDAAEVLIGSSSFVVSSNASATPNNKLNLYNGSTGACIVGAAQAGPGTLMWPVAMLYSTQRQKLFVLYYPTTSATSNAQLWSFDVSATAIGNGSLVFNDVGADIAVITANPSAQSGDLAYFEDETEKSFFIGTTGNSILKLSYNSTTGLATKPAGPHFVGGDAWLRSIAGVWVLEH